MKSIKKYTKKNKKTRKKRGGRPELIELNEDEFKQKLQEQHFYNVIVHSGPEYIGIHSLHLLHLTWMAEIYEQDGRYIINLMDEDGIAVDQDGIFYGPYRFNELKKNPDHDPTKIWLSIYELSGEQFQFNGGGKRRKKTRKYKGNKYPYKNITKKEAIADFIKLKSTTNPRSLNGLEIVNYGTEKLRVKTKYRGKSLIERWRDKKTRKTLKKFANRLYKGPYTDDLLHAYRSAIALSWGTLSSMRTAAALQMYKKYNAKKVLDFTAGWGSRMAAALAADIDYIGIDSNKSLKKGYNKIIKTVKKHTKSKVKLFFQPAETVNYSKLDYDFVFTSPPYEYLELYEHMKNYEGTKKIKQAHSANDKRRKNDGFYDTFLIPTIKEIYKHLPKGKWMCLNVPDLMYDKIKKKWKGCNKKEDYMISKRVGSTMKSDDRRGQEFVYCWKK
jgi:16S rRNA G966 N2-methylase RsmD